MKLYYSPPSPYARLARVAWRELDLGPMVEEIVAHPFEDPATLIAANPLGKIPCLQLEDGAVLYDSEVICRYFDTLARGARLFGSVDQSWPARTRRALLQGMLDVAVGARVNKTVPDAQPSSFWLRRHHAALDRGMTVCEAELEAFESSFSILPLQLACVLDYMQFRLPELDWVSRYPRLADWHSEFTQRASLRETAPEEYHPA